MAIILHHKISLHTLGHTVLHPSGPSSSIIFYRKPPLSPQFGKVCRLSPAPQRPNLIRNTLGVQSRHCRNCADISLLVPLDIHSPSAKSSSHGPQTPFGVPPPPPPSLLSFNCEITS